MKFLVIREGRGFSSLGKLSIVSEHETREEAIEAGKLRLKEDSSHRGGGPERFLLVQAEEIRI
jgi:hypothetical protein